MQHLVQRLLSPRHLRCMNVCACDPACMRCIDQVKVNYVCGYMLVFATANIYIYIDVCGVTCSHILFILIIARSV